MKKPLIVGGVAAGAATGAAILVKRLAARRALDFEQLVERMPDNAPPKWMFLNIRAIRENTERILQLLASERGSPEGGVEAAGESE